MKYLFRTSLLFFLFFLPAAAFSQRMPEITIKASSRISVSYAIPEGFHQTLEKDFFYFELTGFTDSEGKNLINLVRLGEISYPEGIEADDEISYYGTVTLTAPLVMPIGMAPGIYSGQVEAYFQLCSDTGFCFLPEKRTFDFKFSPVPAAAN